MYPFLLKALEIMSGLFILALGIGVVTIIVM
jgi:hypothetical protein